MAVTVDEIVDVGMVFDVFLGEEHQVLTVLSHIVGFLAVGMLQTAVLRPGEAQPHAPAGVDGIEQFLAGAVVEHPLEELELLVGVAQTVAVGKEEHLAVNLGGDGCAVDNHAAFLLQIAVGPYIMVAGEEMHLHAHVGNLGYLA